jgi:SNF2 family DNA or RNA helicase
MLDIVGAALTDAGVPYVRMDGRSSAKAREAALRAFADPALGSPRVFLSSLKCGGVGGWAGAPRGMVLVSYRSLSAACSSCMKTS